MLLTVACGPGDDVKNPTPPKSVHGWNAFDTGAITIKGEFLLRKGESTDNGHIGIKVTDIFPVKYQLLDSWEMPKAKIQFFNVADKTPVCEAVFTRGGNGLNTDALCGSRLDWTDIYIRDVNYNEGWVFFDLR
ncbi:MAG TPA: hypothetical protein VFZ22_14070 [Pyrinomonadaceae bacterium]|nr:hypothetical protein [Pyrinomonadaceae bacterium]